MGGTLVAFLRGRKAVLFLADLKRLQDLLDQLTRRLGAELDCDALASAVRIAGEVDRERVIERRMVRVVVIDVGVVDPHPAPGSLGAADERRLLDDVRAHADLRARSTPPIIAARGRRPGRRCALPSSFAAPTSRL